MKKFIAAAALAGTAVAATAGTAHAQVVANNLVGLNISGNNVNVVDVADVNAEVSVPVGIAANICDVSVAALAELVEAGGTDCDAATNQRTRQGLLQAQRFDLRN